MRLRQKYGTLIMNEPRTKPQVALVTCEAFPNLYEDDLLLVTALDEIGIHSRPAIWSDASIDWLAFEALIIRSPWDYFRRPVEFRGWLDDRIASGVRMINSREILDWNFDKRYLLDLAATGISLVPTIIVPQGESPDIVALARAKGWEDIVIKPTISGGGYRTYRFRFDDANRYHDEIAGILLDRGLLIQPFVPEILSEGELSLLFFDGLFSHAVCKRPKEGDYRVQFQFGGSNKTVEVRDEWIEEARACIAAAPALPVYARVDGVIQNGQFLLMELEVFEPLMFLARHPDSPGRFARAIQRSAECPDRIGSESCKRAFLPETISQSSMPH
jgi:glutathione synthase/RimK-type ligase-like ATP-grasp enzyme